MKKLNVFLLNQHAGTLWTNKTGDFEFQYQKNYLDKLNPRPISLSIPLTDEILSGNCVKSFFSNLLPEGELKTAIAREKKISEKNDFLMLKAIGGECAGAVSIMEQGQKPETENKYELLSENDLEKIIEESKIKPVLIAREDLRLSLAGAQNKIPLYYNNKNFFLPKDSSPSTHILKLENKTFKGLAENEAFCMKLAKNSGIEVPEVFIKKIGEHKIFIIERYDRYLTKTGNVERIHQEDFCQISCTAPGLKYENESGPGLKKCADIINTCCSVPAIDIKKYIQWIIFNYIIGNCDVHAKNISILHSNKIKLAPFYDLISTMAFPELSKKLAMYIGRQKNIDYVLKVHWERFAYDLGIKFSFLKSIIEDLSDKTEIEAKKLEKNFENDFNDIPSKINKIIFRQIKRLKQVYK
jgi:serine/threonine-protein kinase HipA